MASLLGRAICLHQRSFLLVRLVANARKQEMCSPIKCNIKPWWICHQPALFIHKSVVHHKIKKGGSPKVKQLINPKDVEDIVDITVVNMKFQDIVKHLHDDFLSHFRVLTDLTIFEQLKIVMEDGSSVPLCDIGQVVKASPRLLTIDMVSFPEYLKLVESALVASELNINPSTVGNMIKIPISHATSEYRMTITKHARSRAGVCKNELRQLLDSETKSIHSIQGIKTDAKKLISQQYKIYFEQAMQQVEQLIKGKEKAIKET